MFARHLTAFAAIIALSGPALAMPDTGTLHELPPATGPADIRLAQAKKSSPRDAETLYRQCREAVVRMYGRPSGLRDPNQDPLNAEMRMQEAATLDSKIDYCVQNGGRP